MAIIVRTKDRYEAYQSVELLSNLGIRLARRDEFCTDPRVAVSFECDELIAPLIVKLNNLDFKTKACCSGHAYPAVSVNERFHSHEGFQYYDDLMTSNGYIQFEEDNAFIDRIRSMQYITITIDEESPIVRWDIPEDIMDDPMMINRFNMDTIHELYGLANVIEAERRNQSTPEVPEKGDVETHLKDFLDALDNGMDEINVKKLIGAWFKLVGLGITEFPSPDLDTDEYWWWKRLVDRDFRSKETLEWLEKALKNLGNE